LAWPTLRDFEGLVRVFYTATLRPNTHTARIKTRVALHSLSREIPHRAGHSQRRNGRSRSMMFAIACGHSVRTLRLFRTCGREAETGAYPCQSRNARPLMHTRSQPSSLRYPRTPSGVRGVETELARALGHPPPSAKSRPAPAPQAQCGGRLASPPDETVPIPHTLLDSHHSPPVGSLTQKHPNPIQILRCWRL